MSYGCTSVTPKEDSLPQQSTTCTTHFPLKRIVTNGGVFTLGGLKLPGIYTRQAGIRLYSTLHQAGSSFEYEALELRSSKYALNSEQY